MIPCRIMSPLSKFMLTFSLLGFSQALFGQADGAGGSRRRFPVEQHAAVQQSQRQQHYGLKFRSGHQHPRQRPGEREWHRRRAVSSGSLRILF
jgi:hypothetical protein